MARSVDALDGPVAEGHGVAVVQLTLRRAGRHMGVVGADGRRRSDVAGDLRIAGQVVAVPVGDEDCLYVNAGFPHFVDHLLRFVRRVDANGLVGLRADDDVPVVAQRTHILNLVDGNVARPLRLMMDWHTASLL